MTSAAGNIPDGLTTVRRSCRQLQARSVASVPAVALAARMPSPCQPNQRAAPFPTASRNN